MERYFYPRPPRGGRPRTATKKASSGRFLSTPSVRRATHKLYHTTYFNHAFLSTPSARRATFWVIRYLPPLIYFYPRPPRGGRHPLTVPLIELGYVFLSTPSVRRATCRPTSGTARPRTFLSTPSVRRATCEVTHDVQPKQFLSTPSARRATTRA